MHTRTYAPTLTQAHALTHAPALTRILTLTCAHTQYIQNI